MPERLIIRLVLCLLPGLCSASGAALAQAEGEEDRWYRVELMIFRHLPGDFSEQFAATPRLAYPPLVRYLEAARTDVDETGHITAAPFTTLDEGFLDFRSQAGYMRRSGRYRILFHETWAQPVVPKRRALPIVIDRPITEVPAAGTDWPELQGTINLYLSRYLHLETNIWLNTDGSYLDSPWQMPSPPAGPPPDPNSPADEVPVASPELPQAYGAETPAPNSVEALFPFRHAVLLRQKRRMRSEEVHYIDHPVLGVVIQLTPLELPDPEDEEESAPVEEEVTGEEELAGAAPG